jgi:hypothetical protein
MLDTIFHTPWTFMRWLRLGVGVYALVNLFFVPFSFFFLLFGLWFTYQALFNAGCGACAVPIKQSETKGANTETIEFEEIK